MRSSFKIRQIRIAYLFLLPAIIIFLLGLVVPLINTFELSFNRLSMGSRWSRSRLRRLGKLRAHGGGRSRTLFRRRHLALCGIVLVAELVIGMGLALLLEKPIKGAAVFRTIFILPLMVSPVAVGLIWRYLLDGRIGLDQSSTLNQIGIASSNLAWGAGPGVSSPSSLRTSGNGHLLSSLFCSPGLQALAVGGFGSFAYRRRKLVADDLPDQIADASFDSAWLRY